MLSALLPLLALAIALTGVSPLPALAQGGVLRVGLPSLPLELDPAAALDGPLPMIARQIFDTLVQYADSSSDVEPALATQWAVSRDGLVWSFRLRAGVSFHDGTLLTAQHVVDSLEREILPGHALAPSGNAVAPRLLRGMPGVIKGIRAKDPRTVEISLVQPYAPLLTVLAHPAFSIVLPAVATGGGGSRWHGTGPFSITEMGPGRIVLDGKRGHWGGGPRLAGIVFVEAANESQAQAALDASSLDVLFPAGAPPRQNGALSFPSWRIGYLALQTEKEPFKRAKARRAIAAALDPGLIASVLEPIATALPAFLPRGVWGRRDVPPVMGGDAQRAKRLIAESGLPPGVSLSLIVADGDQRILQTQVAEAIRASLLAAGVTVAIRTETPEVALALAQAGDHQMALGEGRVEAGDPHFLLYPLSASEGAVKGAAAVNLSFYRNGRLDDLLIRASQLFFRPERQRLYVRAQGLLADELPWIPLYVRLYWAVLRPEVRNLRLHPSGNPRLDRVGIETSPDASPAGAPPAGR